MLTLADADHAHGYLVKGLQALLTWLSAWAHEKV